MQNILFSTTRQWNPGDEAILFGVRRMLCESGIHHNALIFNRNPEIMQGYIDENPLRRIQRSFKGHSFFSSFFRVGFFDNSFPPTSSFDCVDMVVFAGSPGWNSRCLRSLYKELRNSNVPALFIGLGICDALPEAKNLHSTVRSALRESPLVTVRDSKTAALLAEFDPKTIPCPALVSSSKCKQISRVKRIALIFSSYKSPNNHKISFDSFRIMIAFYKNLIGQLKTGIEFKFVAHYIDEVFHFKKIMTNEEIYYSFDAAEYYSIYEHFDFVIGPRVHGIGIAASIGIPGIHLAHDSRSETVGGFLACDWQLNETLLEPKRIDEIQKIIDEAPLRNKKLIEHKKDVEKLYTLAIKEAIDGII